MNTFRFRENKIFWGQYSIVNTCFMEGKGVCRCDECSSTLAEKWVLFFSIFSSLSWTSLYIQVPFPSSLILGGNWPHLTSVVDIQFKFIVGVRVVWYWLLRCCNLLLAFWAFARDICFSHYFNFWINRISYQVEIWTLMNLISETFPIFCYHPACLSATELFSDFLFGHAVALSVWLFMKGVKCA